MFKCESCETQQVSGTKLNKVTTQTRMVTYPTIKDSTGRIVKTPVGYETVKEVCVCPNCASKGFNVVVVAEKTLI